ncbi:MAG: LysR family transcriptional regulator, partial [Geminicoccaceae bacterium]|nr:LysR family transcriptional regulator [Geminicoccaceae bacterium]
MDDAAAFQDAAGGETGTVAEAKRRAAIHPTLHQLRVFWAVARSATLTAAAKQLGLTQPSLSHQLSKLETTVGSPLFHRRHNEMELTAAGHYLLPHAEHILRILSEVEDGLGRFRDGYQPVVKVAGISSVLRSVLSVAVKEMQLRFPDVSYDVQDSAPADILELLYSRRINIGLLAANSLGQDRTSFRQFPVLEDPYVLVVPASLSLDGITDPE